MPHTQINLADSVVVTNTGASTFYRAYRFDGATMLAQTGENGELLLLGTPGRTYQLQSAAEPGPTALWLPVDSVTLTNFWQRIDAAGQVPTNHYLRVVE